MAQAADARDTFRRISHAVGVRLAERRNELGKALRDVSAESEVSTSHLSDIENGVCQVSLPVLLRIVRALDLTITELLPRIGGHQVSGGTIGEVEPGTSAVLSHPELELRIELVHLVAGATHVIDNPSLADVLVHPLGGAARVAADGAEVRLEAGDTLDTERVGRHVITAVADAQILVAKGASCG